MLNLFLFNDTATTEIYTLSLHDALPISSRGGWAGPPGRRCRGVHRGGAGPRTAWHDPPGAKQPGLRDRKSTRLNSSHANISYAVFCLKKKTMMRLDLPLMMHPSRSLPAH